MKVILLFDEKFINTLGGHQNRTNQIYSTLLKENYEVFTCSRDINSDLVIRSKNKNKMIFPSNLYSFSNKEILNILFFIKENNIDLLFFRSVSYADVASKINKLDKNLDIIIDMDLITSRLMKQSWSENKSIRNRYYFLESNKLEIFESKLFNSNMKILLSNFSEYLTIKENYPLSNIEYLPNTTLVNEVKNIESDKNIILMYGMMNSTANINAYNFINEKLIKKIKSTLIRNNYKIRIIGRGTEKLNKSNDSSILEVVGEAESIESEILDSKFVLLPISIGSGTNTRVIEVGMLNRPIISSELGFEGFSEHKEDFVFTDIDECVEIIETLIGNKCLRNKNAMRLNEIVKDKTSLSLFNSSLIKLIESQGNNLNVVHIPRRFTKKSWGGTETVIVNSAKELKNYGFNSIIATTKALDKKDFELINNIPVIRHEYIYPYTSISKERKTEFDNIGGNLFSFGLFKYLNKLNKVDLIHLHTANRLGAIGRHFAKRRKIPYIITLHGGFFNISESEKEKRVSQLSNGFEWGKILGFIFGSRKVIPEANAIITLSESEYESSKKAFGEDKVFYLRNGVDTGKFSSGNGINFYNEFRINKKRKIILCSARIDTQKNQLLLIKTFNNLLKQVDSYQLVLLGAISDIEYYDILIELINEFDISDRVTFSSNLTPDDQLLIDAYDAANILILPSKHEPFGMVILEAWAANTAVIASNVGGIPKIITDKENGLLFDPNSEVDLYIKLITLIKDSELREKIKIKASSDVKNYDWSVVANDLKEIYKKVIMEKKNENNN